MFKEGLDDHVVLSNLHCLNTLEKKVIVLTLLDWQPKEIGDNIGESRQYISVARSNAVKKLRKLNLKRDD
ncbi:MAG: hypothetical protein GQ540_03260 [Lutibacter sp.]|uniref:hypothetical protein n=1 Tax=Lutibacter sp. TaxID=1925666 RepID=UPI001A0A889E|nr:hypothetical protein [Lutibacter sp.]NOR27530.1 hypothetical protein [Lutibacter sp.]